MSHLVKISKYLLKEIGNSKHLIEKIGKHNKRHLTSFKKWLDGVYDFFLISLEFPNFQSETELMAIGKLLFCTNTPDFLPITQSLGF